MLWNFDMLYWKIQLYKKFIIYTKFVAQIMSMIRKYNLKAVSFQFVSNRNQDCYDFWEIGATTLGMTVWRDSCYNSGLVLDGQLIAVDQALWEFIGLVIMLYGDHFFR